MTKVMKIGGFENKNILFFVMVAAAGTSHSRHFESSKQEAQVEQITFLITAFHLGEPFTVLALVLLMFTL